MKKFALMATILAAPLPLQAQAGVITNACLNGDRPGSRALCGCIQQAADLTLGHADQRRAARFFADPHRAQEVRASDTDRDNAFWGRYRNFGQTAEAMCAN